MPPVSFAISNILVLCERYNIAISNLADAAGISQSTLTRAVKNEQTGSSERTLSLRTFDRIASFFNISTNLLISHELTPLDADAIAKANGLEERPDRMIRKLINNKMPLPFCTGDNSEGRITSLSELAQNPPRMATNLGKAPLPHRSALGQPAFISMYSTDALVNAVKENTTFEEVVCDQESVLPNPVPPSECWTKDVVFAYTVTGEGLPPKVNQGDVIVVRRLRAGELVALKPDTVVLACTQYSQTAPNPEEYGLSLRYVQEGEWGTSMLSSVPRDQLPNGITSVIAPDGRNILGIVLYSITKL